MGAKSKSDDPGMDFSNRFTIKELQLQFSPHHWSRKENHDKAQLVTNHFEVTREGTSRVKNELSCQLDYHYGVQESQCFDIYGTDLPPAGPVFVWVHGGGWQFGNKSYNGFFAATLHRWGFKTIVFGYSLAPQASVTQMVGELKDGLRAAFRKYPKANFVLGGHSAGAHLASTVIHDEGLDCSQLKRIFLCSGIYDIRPFRQTIFNKTTKITEDESLALSPLIQSKRNPTLGKEFKVLVAVGKHESELFLTHARLYSDHLKNNLGLSSSCWISEEDDHFSIIETLTDENSAMAMQLKSLLVDLLPRRGIFRLCRL